MEGDSQSKTIRSLADVVRKLELLRIYNAYLCLYLTLYYRRDPTKQVYADANGNALPGSSAPLSAPASASEVQQQSDQPQNQTQPSLSLKTEDVQM